MAAQEGRPRGMQGIARRVRALPAAICPGDASEQQRGAAVRSLRYLRDVLASQLATHQPAEVAGRSRSDGAADPAARIDGGLPEDQIAVPERRLEGSGAELRASAEERAADAVQARPSDRDDGSSDGDSDCDMDLLGGEPGWEVAGGVEAAPEGSVLALALCSGGHLCAVVREAGDFQLRLWRADHTLVASGSLNAPRDGRRCSRWLGRLAECAPFAAVSRLHEPAWSARAGATRLLIALPSGLLPDNTPPEMSPAPGVADAVVAAAVAWPEPEKDPASAPRPGTIAGMLSQRARAKASGNTPSPGAGRSGPPELLCAVSAPHEAPGTILAGGAGGVLLAVSPSASGTALRNIAWRHRVLPRAEFRSIALPDVVRLEVVAARPRLVAGVSSNGSVAVWDTAGGGQLLCGVCEHDLCVLSIQLCHLRDDAALPAVGMVLTRPRTASAGGFGGGGAGGCFGSERQGVGGLEDPAAHRRRLSAYKVLVTEPDAAGRQMHFGVELPTRGVCSCAWGLGMGVFGFSSGHVVMWDVVSGEAVAAVEVPRRADQGDSGAHPRERVVQVGLRPGRRGGIEVMWRGSEGGGGTFVLSQTPVTRCPGEDSPGALCEVAGAGVAGRGEVGALA